MATSFTVNLGDLAFILRQIKISEDTSLAYTDTPKTILQSIMDEYGASAETATQLPFGLRTIRGDYNSLIPGQELFGAADTLFPRLLEPDFRDDADGDVMPLGPGPFAPVVDNTDYGQVGQNVADADPRIISNLVVDLSVDNPAAIAAFLNNPLSVAAFEEQYGFTPTSAWLNDPANRAAANEALQVLPNQSPDVGLSKGFNSWMTFFGQFFDHGLDLVTKGNAGTVYIPLQDDDPLLAGADGIFGTADDLPEHLRFMALTRATPTLDENGVPQHENTTSPFVDQNQTYTSHASHQVFLREYELIDGVPVATGKLLDGALEHSLSDWGDVKAQALEKLGIALTDFDVHNVPLLVTDQYGKFVPGPNGYPQFVLSDGSFLEASPGGTAVPGNALRTNHQFLIDIAHHAAPDVVTRDPNTGAPLAIPVAQVADQDIISGFDALDEIDQTGDGLYTLADVEAQAAAADLDGSVVVDGEVTLDELNEITGDATVSGNILAALDTNQDGVISEADDTQVSDDGNPFTYDDEMLEAHYVTGDGRGNENAALTAVHSVFHSEHNRMVDANKVTILSSGDPAFINEWLALDLTAQQATDLAALDSTDAAALAAFADTLRWDGERLFQAAKFSTEMQYQHLVFEEFGRTIQPAIDPFVFNNSPDVDPSILAEFAHTVYRFGHSMLTGTVDRLDNSLNPLDGATEQETLLATFLNPQIYAASGATTEEINANFVRGLTRDVGSAIDEHIVDDLRSNLLGLPLDLATLNLARGRETGVPSLNNARAQLYDGTGLTALKPYTSWIDFTAHLKNPLSIVNFIAAYGTHQSIQDQDTLAGKRAAAMELVFGTEEFLMSTTAATIANSNFEANSLASGQPSVISHSLGNYTTTAPTGWTITGGVGGLYDPADSVSDPSGHDGGNVVWLRQGATLAQNTGVVLAEGASYELTFKVGDRTNMAWPGGTARLVADDGVNPPVVLSAIALPEPADGQWAPVTLNSGDIDAALAGRTLRIEIQQNAAGGSNQILIDNIALTQTLMESVNGAGVPADRLDFLNGRGAYANGLGGLNDVDFWVGGLAEANPEFGGMLGTTFNYVFEYQMEALQNGDRFYYLTRTQGLNLLNVLENNTFADLVMRNTDLGQNPHSTHISGQIFLTPDHIIELDRGIAQADYNPDNDLGFDPDDTQMRDPVGAPGEFIFNSKVVRDYSNAGQVVDPVTGITHDVGGFLQFFGGEHVVLGGTEGNDTLIGGIGDDTLWGDAGDDYLNGGDGADQVFGGAGDDIIEDSFGDDVLRGEAGNDVISTSAGIDLVIAGQDSDYVVLGLDASEVFGGEGNDFILGSAGGDFLLGNEGDDWIEGAAGFDTLAGDNSDLFFNSPIQGHDVLFGHGDETDYDAESGDDIMGSGPSVFRYEGMFGFDWGIAKNDTSAIDFDLTRPIFTTDVNDILRDRFDNVEALSGWDGDDVLAGDDKGHVFGVGEVAAPGGANPLDVMFYDVDATGAVVVDNLLTQAGVDRINGFREWFDGATTTLGTEGLGPVADTFFREGNVLMGGGGSDTIMGRGGFDIIDGDAWLNVRIQIVIPDGPHAGTYSAESMSTDTAVAGPYAGRVFNVDANGDPDFSSPAFGGRALTSLMLDRTINPGNM
ncbi:MAG: hypothetical protein O3C67_00785, partial [Cyanobacteria bacterium]|nr:hypothetical protein [Cyanobacteriota bacterium]